MFICNQCLEENYTNSESITKSAGRCEICGESHACNDIRSSLLMLKPKSLDTPEHRLELEYRINFIGVFLRWKGKGEIILTQHNKLRELMISYMNLIINHEKSDVVIHLQDFIGEHIKEEFIKLPSIALIDAMDKAIEVMTQEGAFNE